MGILKKIKDIFYDEEIVEETVEEPKTVKPTPVNKVENTAPIIEEIKPIKEVKFVEEEEQPERISKYSERELFKPEKTFDFPVFEEEEEPVRTRSSKTNVLELQRELEQRNINTRNRDFERSVEPKVEVKKQSTFKPSPVISPVYGILDKNYTKEEIVERKDSQRPYSGEINYDYVRKKAYGTLEDELEDTITRVNTNVVKEVEKIEKELDELPKLSESKNIEDLLGQIEKNATIGDLEEKAKNAMLEEEEKEAAEEIVTDDGDGTLERDLFNLIDSMYEDKEE